MQTISFEATKLERAGIVLQLLMVLLTGGGSGLFAAAILAVPILAVPF